jgi:hypothetical protein
MSSRRGAPQQVPADEVETHEAVHAWRELFPAAPVRDIVVLVRKTKTAVFRLELAGAPRQVVIAKRCAPNYAVGNLEQRIYRDVLPAAGLPTLRIYGRVAETEQTPSWLFMEDLGDQEARMDSIDDRRRFGAWLAALHRWPGVHATDINLRDCGPAGYLRHLRETQALIAQHIAQPWVTPSAQQVLSRVQWLLGDLERSWDRVDALCAATPAALVHGDLVSKNLRWRGQDGVVDLVALDWETAGLGVPSIDLKLLGDELEHYAELMQEVSPAMSLAHVRRLAGVGRVFRTLAVLFWQARNLAYDWCYLPGFEPLEPRLAADVRFLESGS